MRVGAQALVQAGAYAKEEVCRTLVVLISNEPKLHAYAARQSYRALQAGSQDASLLLTTTATWFLGEGSLDLLELSRRHDTEIPVQGGRRAVVQASTETRLWARGRCWKGRSPSRCLQSGWSACWAACWLSPTRLWSRQSIPSRLS